MDTRPPSLADTEHAIRRYLQAHPHAFDTARGIGEWWLRDVQPLPFASDVHLAIQRLVAGGTLVAVTLPDGQRGYANAHPNGHPGPYLDPP